MMAVIGMKKCLNQVIVTGTKNNMRHIEIIDYENIENYSSKFFVEHGKLYCCYNYI